MTSDARPPFRAVRAALFAAVCVTLAAAGHAVMSGHGIPPGVLGAALAVVGAAAWLAAGRQRGLPAIAGGVLTVQAALHLAFAAAQGSGAGVPMACGMSGGAGTHGATGMHGAADAHGASGMHGMTGAHGVTGMHAGHDMAGMSGGGAAMGAGHDMAGGMSAGMTAAHLLAALLCALWLRYGEAAFFQLLRCVAALAFRALRLLVVICRGPAPERRTRVPARTRPRVPRWELIADAVSRRGPPPGAVLRITAPAGPPLPR
ncbi:hypothetical protein [Streptomyces sp. NPDC053560]|uniref:hypothetical protein n=1 Tax=Streptomyces sp. NPDC053560 TaxID=3365711 RepID=UPI0037CCD027